MSLTNFYANFFSSSSRRKGAQYYEEDRVLLTEIEDDRITAEVTGTDVYTVEIQVDDSSLDASCECPAFDQEGYCKHLWATFLASDSAGHLRSASAKKLAYTPLGSSFDDDDLFYETPQTDSIFEAPEIFESKKSSPTAWKSILYGLEPPRQSATLTLRQHIIYVVDFALSAQSQRLVLQVFVQEQKLNGEMSRPKRVYLPSSSVPQLPDPEDVKFLSILSGTRESSDYSYYYSPPDKSAITSYRLTPTLAKHILPMIANVGRLYFLREQDSRNPEPLQWDTGDPFSFRLRIDSLQQDSYEVKGVVSRNSEEYDVNDLDLISQEFIIRNGSASLFNSRNSFQLISNLRSTRSLLIPRKQIYKFIKEVVEKIDSEICEFSADLEIQSVEFQPRPHLIFKAGGNTGLEGNVSYFYGDDVSFKESEPRSALFETKSRRLYLRDMKAEATWLRRFEEAGLRRYTDSYTTGPVWRVGQNRFPQVVRSLLKEGCTVFAEGKHLRRSGTITISVTSGIDWFELDGAADFEGESVKFPVLLAALKRGENMVRLSDGSYGMIPEEWLKKYGAVTALGEIHDEHLRYKRTQAGILDAMLAMQPEATFDEVFEKARIQLHSFEGVHPLEPPSDFQGTLRDYQKEALGWMKFLREFGFGGCLADDMGLGKTVMVLAMLLSRRDGIGENLPSLVVVPRSLIFNWMREASRFVPTLRVLDYTGILRKKHNADLKGYDLILTTYGTLRSDAPFLKDQLFDYIILDEAQAVKNSSTASAKAVRLLQGRHRLALSGTPVQNHLGDLWSLFDFLNSGMLGASSVLSLSGSGGKQPEEETVKMLARALRPFILRRTKEQVATELPKKLEQTLFCELTPNERKLYDELRDHYRQALMSRIDSVGISKSKIQVLEALLRLRQAACHPGLIDHNRTTELSTKLETLLPQLNAVMEEGHKALVFSQFVSLLTILRHHLDQSGIQYQYLDGHTSDRQSPVETFQNDSDSKLFLISLKAGGLGLNLTAADYVFLLDPWWNPVIETQAIDRAHRIGQTRQVFAYRIIARNTVEEKVLKLQETKRNLADAIITADNSILRSMEREDLELLLS